MHFSMREEEMENKEKKKCNDCEDGNLCCDTEDTYPAIITERGFTCDNCNQGIREIKILEKNKKEKIVTIHNNISEIKE